MLNCDFFWLCYCSVNIQPPRKKAKVEMKGFKEDPFVFLKEDDEHWPEIKWVHLKIHCTELDSMIYLSGHSIVIKLIRFSHQTKSNQLYLVGTLLLKWTLLILYLSLQRKFYGIDDNFPADQLLVRSVGGKKRNIYLVSKTVKDAMDLIDDNHKVCCITLDHGNSLLVIATQVIQPKCSRNLVEPSVSLPWAVMCTWQVCVYTIYLWLSG